MDFLEDVYNDYRVDASSQDLRDKGSNFVPGHGPDIPSIMLVGEAPGRTENDKRLPFTGKTGRLTKNLLRDMGQDTDRVFFTNLIKFWPVDRKPTDLEYEGAREFLLREIDALSPTIVGLCGMTVLKTIYPNEKGMKNNNGVMLDDKFVPLMNPSSIFYDDKKKDQVKEGFQSLLIHLRYK